jgi:glycosyltransferase involved in cell wall biosynthesis
VKVYMDRPVFPGKVGLQQRMLPEYRQVFIDALAVACQGGLDLFAGQPLPQENVKPASKLYNARYVPARNYNLFPIDSNLYHCWQSGLLTWLEDWQPDVLVVEANPRYPSTRLAVRWMHARGRPVVGWGLGAPPIDPRRISAPTPLSQLLAAWQKWERMSFLHSLDGLIAYSQRGAQQYRELGLRIKDISVAPNAVSPRPTSDVPTTRPPVFDGPGTVLYVGRLQQRKRIDNLLRACANLPHHLQPRLWIVGDGPARAGLEQLAIETYPQAEFFGARHGSELPPIFFAADLFVLPGTGGLAVQQAMTYALPVIVAEGDGTQADLVRPENGFLVPAQDLPALTAALKAALSDPAKLREMGAESYRIVYEEINVEAMVSAFVNALVNVMRRS